VGQAVETAFLVPDAAIGFWIDRLIAAAVDHDKPVKRFGETVIAFRDPDGMHLELVGRASAGALPGHAQAGVPAEHAIRGFAGVTLWVDRPDGTRRVLEEVFGYRFTGEDDGRLRFIAPGGAIADRIDLRVVGGFLRGVPGAGTLHHIAFRARDDAEQARMATALRERGIGATEQMDRNYFCSIYFREPGGVIFEIATDAPGFAVDEPADQLGQKLMLPAWLEPNRREVEKALPALV
jgi:glyoxalase family protein